MGGRFSKVQAEFPGPFVKGGTCFRVECRLKFENHIFDLVSIKAWSAPNAQSANYGFCKQHLEGTFVVDVLRNAQSRVEIIVPKPVKFDSERRNGPIPMVLAAPIILNYGVVAALTHWASRHVSDNCWNRHALDNTVGALLHEPGTFE